MLYLTVLLLTACVVATSGQSGTAAQLSGSSALQSEEAPVDGGRFRQALSLIEQISPSLAPSAILLPHESVSSACRSFVHVPNAFALGGDVLHKVSDNLTPAECRQACLDAANFVCAAAQIQSPGTCFVHGYRLHSVHFSTHYVRVCNHGPTCFTKIDNASARFGADGTGSGGGVQIPQPYARSADIYPLYCMAHCELMNQHCIGFDVRVSNSVPRCYFANLRIVTGSSAELFMRKC